MRTVLVTRPEREAAAWVQALREQGWPAQALPLIDIRPASDTLALQRYQDAADGYDALMLVSPQAVAHFAAPSWIEGRVRCWAPGPGTARALLSLGVGPTRIDQPDPDAGQFDSEALWPVVTPQVRPGHRLLLVRGASAGGQDGRDWLMQRCRAVGASVDSCIAYRRCVPDWDEAMSALALRGLEDGALWLFSSSQALHNLRQLLPSVSFAHIKALVTHPRIEESARNMGFGEIITTRATLSDVLQSLQSAPSDHVHAGKR